VIAREHMTVHDLAWLHMDEPRSPVDVVGMICLAEPMRLSELRRLLATRLVRHPPFRRRVVGRGLLGGADWDEDPAFTISRHVLVHRLAGEWRSALEEFVGQVATQPLDARYPLWRAWLVHGRGGRCAIVLKLHHCIGDGFAMMEVLLSLGDEHASAAPPARPAPAYRDLSFDANHFASHAAQFAWSLGRNVLLPADPHTVLWRSLSGRRRVAWSEGMPLSRIREVAHRNGATVNDFVVAALTGALREHLESSGEAVDHMDIRAVVPVNVRPAGASAAGLGNRFGIVFLELPVHLRTPAARLAGVRGRMAELKGSPDALVSRATLAAMGMAPTAVERTLIDFFMQKASLVVTNVPGPQRHLHMGGKRIEEVRFWVPHPGGLGLGVSIFSYAGSLSIGVRADVATVPEPSDLVRRFAEQIEALEAA
jgi:diacylglycerol O-acyltransferase